MEKVLCSRKDPVLARSLYPEIFLAVCACQSKCFFWSKLPFSILLEQTVSWCVAEGSLCLILPVKTIQDNLRCSQWLASSHPPSLLFKLVHSAVVEDVSLFSWTTPILPVIFTQNDCPIRTSCRLLTNISPWIKVEFTVELNRTCFLFSLVTNNFTVK